jgi:hypothetical protein
LTYIECGKEEQFVETGIELFPVENNGQTFGKIKQSRWNRNGQTNGLANVNVKIGRFIWRGHRQFLVRKNLLFNLMKMEGKMPIYNVMVLAE